jgi:hypothetical protein
MPYIVNTVWYVAGSSGLADFSDGAALTGYRSITDAVAAGALTNGAVYSYRAEHPTDKSIWENGSGAVNTGTKVLARTTIAESSTGAKINFAVAPVVILTEMKRDWDLLAPLASPSFTGNGSISGTFGVGGVLSVTDVTEASGSSAGSINTAGGINAAKAIKSGSTTTSTSTTTGSGIFAGGLGVAGKGYFGGALNVTDTTASSSPTTGSGIFGGGLGVAGKAYFGGGINIGSTTSPSTDVALECANMTITHTSGAHNAICAAGNFYGILFIGDPSLTGGSALWICSNGTAVLVSQASGGPSWVASTTTPAADKYSIAHDGTNWRFYSNSSSTITVRVMALKVV